MNTRPTLLKISIRSLKYLSAELPVIGCRLRHDLVAAPEPPAHLQRSLLLLISRQVFTNEDRFNSAESTGCVTGYS
jgi:hypothetical protein